jgi:hypothetical protein
MTYKVYTATEMNREFLPVLPGAKPGFAHLSSADSVAHSQFMSDPNNLTVEVRSIGDDGKETLVYALTPKTHIVKHGRVRPINRDSADDTPSTATPITVTPDGKLERTVKEIDLTPKWVGLLPMLLWALEHGSEPNKKMAKEELLRMAKAADAWNEHCKSSPD